MAGQLPAWLDDLGREAEDAFSDPDRPTRRPGSHLLLTAGQWDLYDQLCALRERQLERFGDAAERLANRGYGVAFGGVDFSRGRMLL